MAMGLDYVEYARYFQAMIRKLPFVWRIFWKVLVTVVVLVLVAWFLVTRLSDYKMTAADYGGSTICTVLLAYLVHLWLLPPEDTGPGENPPHDEHLPPGQDSPPDSRSGP